MVKWKDYTLDDDYSQSTVLSVGEEIWAGVGGWTAAISQSDDNSYSPGSESEDEYPTDCNGNVDYGAVGVPFDLEEQDLVDSGLQAPVDLDQQALIELDEQVAPEIPAIVRCSTRRRVEKIR